MWWIWHDPEMIIGACHFSCMWSTRPKKGELSLHQEAANYSSGASPIHSPWQSGTDHCTYQDILQSYFGFGLSAFTNNSIFKHPVTKKAFCQVFLTRSLGARWARLICHSPGPPDPLNPRTLDPSDPEPTGPWTHRTLNPPDPGPTDPGPRTPGPPTPVPDRLWAHRVCLTSKNFTKKSKKIHQEIQKKSPKNVMFATLPTTKSTSMSTFICFFAAAPAVTTTVGAVAKTHRFVWRPQEVVSKVALIHMWCSQNFLTDGGTDKAILGEGFFFNTGVWIPFNFTPPEFQWEKYGKITTTNDQSVEEDWKKDIGGIYLQSLSPSGQLVPSQ